MEEGCIETVMCIIAMNTRVYRIPGYNIKAVTTKAGAAFGPFFFALEGIDVW